MAEQYITKRKKVDGKVVETKYRIDADFIPSSVADISSEFIENYCVAKGEIDWLVAEVNKTSFEKTNKDGTKKTVECDNYPFVNLRADFVHRFFPSILVSKASVETFKDRINRLYKRQGRIWITSFILLKVVKNLLQLSLTQEKALNSCLVATKEKKKTNLLLLNFLRLILILLMNAKSLLALMITVLKQDFGKPPTKKNTKQE